MEEFQVLRDKAMQKIKVADHMLFMTYPVIKDPKLLLAIVENIFASLDFGVGALLHYERLFKRIPPFNDTYPSRMEVFRSRMIPKHNLSPKYASLIMDVKGILSEHKNSPVSFIRKDKYVICSPTYSMKSIDVNLVKKYIFETKVFLTSVNKIVSENERIFVRSQG
jgi:hypothetical protein